MHISHGRILKSANEHTIIWPIAAIALLGVAQLYIYWRFFLQAYPLIPYYTVPLMDGGKISGWKDNAAIEQGISYILLIICYYSAYQICLYLARKHPEPAAMHWPGITMPIIIIGVAVVACVILLFTYPYTAADIFQNIVYARIITVHGSNPMIVAPNQVADQYLPYIAWPDLPTTYGPLWVLSSALAAWLAGNDLLRLLIFFKLLTVLWYFFGIWLLWMLMQRIRPALTWANLLLFAWNPLLLFEVACNAHNDIMMAALMLLAIYLLASGKLELALLALSASMLVKYLTVALWPLFILYILSNPSFGTIRRRINRIGLGILLSGVLVLISYMPFVWGNGLAAIFQGLRQQSDLATTSLAEVLRLWYNREGIIPQDTINEDIKRLLIVMFGILYLPQLWRATRGFSQMLAAGYDTFLVYMLFVAFWFQPWYLIWLIALAAAWPGFADYNRLEQHSDQLLAARTTLYTFTALLTYVIYYLVALHPIGEWNTQAWSFMLAHLPVAILTLLQAPLFFKNAFGYRETPREANSSHHQIADLQPMQNK